MNSELAYIKNEKPTDYRKLRLSNINTEQFKHIKLLLYWPVYGLLFMFVEKYYNVVFTPVYSIFDDMIPFCEYFMIPYLFWFLFLVGMLAYTFFFDVESFRRMMHFIILTYTVTIIIYFLFPTCQELRPSEFVRDNVFTRITKGFYAYDTNTNVCPSIHVIGSWAVVFAAWHCKNIKSSVVNIIFTLTGILISISTVFLKQHSVIDVLAAIPLCVIGYIMCYKIRGKKGLLSY